MLQPISAPTVVPSTLPSTRAATPQATPHATALVVPLSAADRRKVLYFAASFLWADLTVAEPERRFLTELARELEIDDAPREVATLLTYPPVPEDIDPTEVSPAIADTVRSAALRAIAADGRVANEEMSMFELLDDLLPKKELTPAPALALRSPGVGRSGVP